MFSRSALVEFAIPPAGTGNHITGQLASLPDYAEFTALFQQYKFEKIQLKFFASGAPQSATLFVATNRNYETGGPGTVQLMMQRSNLKTQSLGPAQPDMTYTLHKPYSYSAPAGQETVGNNNWINTSNPQTSWNGVDVYIAQPLGGGTAGILKCEVKAFVKFRGSK